MRELIVSVGLNQALKGRPGRIAVEFRTSVNGLVAGLASSWKTSAQLKFFNFLIRF